MQLTPQTREVQRTDPVLPEAEFGMRLRQCREQQGISLREMARRLTRSHSNLWDYENSTCPQASCRCRWKKPGASCTAWTATGAGRSGRPLRCRRQPRRPRIGRLRIGQARIRRPRIRRPRIGQARIGRARTSPARRAPPPLAPRTDAETGARVGRSSAGTTK